MDRFLRMNETDRSFVHETVAVLRLWDGGWPRFYDIASYTVKDCLLCT
jgi:hypothetical protein